VGKKFSDGDFKLLTMIFSENFLSVENGPLKQGEMDDDMVSVNLTMLNINAISLQHALLHLYSNYNIMLLLTSHWKRAKLEVIIERPAEHITASFPIILSANCSNLHPCTVSYTTTATFLLAFIYT
jgi:hypothetical protein